MATFVLIHGSWHGGWCWERVAPLLEAAGHKVLAPDLPGMGEDKTLLKDVTFEGWARFVVDLIAKEAAPVVLVGHSRGGIVISQAAELAPERVARLIYLTAFAPKDGQNVMEMAQQSPDPPELTIDVIDVGADGVSCTVKAPHVAPIFYGTTEPEWAARAASKLTPEPMVALTSPARVSAANLGRVPKSYIECRGDRAITLGLQRLMQQNWAFDEVVTLEGDHSPFYGRPAELAAALLKLAA